MSLINTGSSLARAAILLLPFAIAACGGAAASPSATAEPSVVATAAPSATASPTTPAGEPEPSPSQAGNPRFVDLAIANGATVRLEVDDRTGTLVDAIGGHAGDGASVPLDRPSVVNDDPATLRVTWAAPPCDTDPALFLDAGTLLLVQPPCPNGSDAIAFDRVVVLRFSVPTDAAALVTVLQDGRDTGVE